MAFQGPPNSQPPQQQIIHLQQHNTPAPTMPQQQHQTQPHQQQQQLQPIQGAKSFLGSDLGGSANSLDNPVLEELRDKNEYNPQDFDFETTNLAR